MKVFNVIIGWQKPVKIAADRMADDGEWLTFYVNDESVGQFRKDAVAGLWIDCEPPVTTFTFHNVSQPCDARKILDQAVNELRNRGTAI